LSFAFTVKFIAAIGTVRLTVAGPVLEDATTIVVAGELVALAQTVAFITAVTAVVVAVTVVLVVDAVTVTAGEPPLSAHVAVGFVGVVTTVVVSVTHPALLSALAVGALELVLEAAAYAVLLIAPVIAVIVHVADVVGVDAATVVALELVGPAPGTWRRSDGDRWWAVSHGADFTAVVSTTARVAAIEIGCARAAPPWSNRTCFMYSMRLCSHHCRRSQVDNYHKEEN